MERARLTIAMKVNAVRRMRQAREIVKCSVSVQFRTVEMVPNTKQPKTDKAKKLDSPSVCQFINFNSARYAAINKPASM